MTVSRTMDYQQLLERRRSHPAWRLLLADHAPMIASFLDSCFIEPNARSLPRVELASLLEDHLFRLHDTAGEKLFPKAATAYLDDWSSDARGWLRKYYPSGEDDPHYDLTAAGGLALAWLRALAQRPVIGAEARARTVVHLLREIAAGSEFTPRGRIAALRRQKAHIEAEISRIEQGRFELMEPALVRERFLHAEDLARGLLSDFRAIDHALGKAGRQMREHPGPATPSSQSDPLAAIDEVVSLRAFRELLMSSDFRDEVSGLFDQVLALEPVRQLSPDSRLRRIHYDWLDAAEPARQTMERLSLQLRRQADERQRLENLRVVQLVRAIEHKALAVREHAPDTDFTEIDEQSPALALPMDRVLFNPPLKARITLQPAGDACDPVPADALFAHELVDHARLIANVRNALASRSQVSLGAIAREYPIEQGLSELAAYLQLGSDALRCAVDEEQTESVDWTDSGGMPRQAVLPLVIFTR